MNTIKDNQLQDDDLIKILNLLEEKRPNGEWLSLMVSNQDIPNLINEHNYNKIMEVVNKL